MTHLHFHEKDLPKGLSGFEANVALEKLKEPYDFDVLAEEVAKQRGLVVVWPEENQLQFDLDSKEELAELYHRWHEFTSNTLDVDLKNGVFVTAWDLEQHETQSPGHYHVTITFTNRKFTEWERIALQSVLGSDPMREFLNAKRLFLNHTERPSRLFETPEIATKLKEPKPIEEDIHF